MALLTLDYVKIMKGENRPLLYDVDDIKEMVKHTIILDYDEVTDITPDLRLTLYNSGHILGSAMAHINIGNGLHNLLYTGDIKYGKTPLLEPAVTMFPRLETVILEGTYGGRQNIQPPAQESDKQLLEQITTTLKRGGKVLMPVLGS
jgi:hypothetical protein